MVNEGFEPPKAVPFDLQSNPVDHLGNSPNFFNYISKSNI